MANWTTIHVFGYGESQMIGPDKNGATTNSNLNTLAPLVSYLASMQQAGTTINMEQLFALNMFNQLFVDFFPNNKDNKMQRFELDGLDMSYINNLADELANKIP